MTTEQKEPFSWAGLFGLIGITILIFGPLYLYEKWKLSKMTQAEKMQYWENNDIMSLEYR